MKARKWMVRIVAFGMAFLMLLSAVVILIQIFAHSVDGTTVAIAATGVQSSSPWVIYVGLAAILIIGVCFVIPKMMKKN